MSVAELFNGLAITDHAKTAQYEIAEHLRSKGYTVVLEHPVPDAGNGTSGRIDIIATRKNERLAIEVDRSSPRDKSMFKLKSMSGYTPIVLLRNGNYNFIRDSVIIYSLTLKESL